MMKALNEDLQMRSDWYLPLCKGKERIKVNGSKAHATQKPESLLYRVILSSSNTGDVVLDPFFGTGTTGAVAKKLARRWIGIEQDKDYAHLARQRIDAIQPPSFEAELANHFQRQPVKRIPFGALLEYGLLQPGQRLYFDRRQDMAAVILADGHLRYGTVQGSIHQVGRTILDAPCNGWDYWYYNDDVSGELLTIDRLRQKILADL